MTLELERVRRELKRVADPKKAPQMQAYMKSVMPYHGVPAPLLQKTCRALFKDIEFSSFEDWRKQVLALWRGARFREERYVALRLTDHRHAREYQTLKAMPLYEELIVDGAWWDYVDEIASNRVGPILEKDPVPMKKLMLKWSRSPDMWKRRASIISQLFFKKDTDLKLLYACIEPSIESKEFFLRKAIGWALRQHARVDPKEVKRYVLENEERLSGLSKREALKHL